MIKVAELEEVSSSSENKNVGQEPATNKEEKKAETDSGAKQPGTLF